MSHRTTGGQHDSCRLCIKPILQDAPAGDAPHLDAGTLQAISNQRRMAVVHADNRHLASGDQAFLDVGIMLHGSVPVEMIRRQVEQDTGGRIDRRCKIDLIRGALDHIKATGLRRIERQHRRADIAAKLRIAPACAQDVRNQRRGGGFAIGAGDRDERAIRGMRPTLAHEKLHVADNLDAARAGKIHRPVRFGMRQRHARRQNEGRPRRPVDAVQVSGHDSCCRGFCHAVRVVVPGDDFGTTGHERACGRQARATETEERNLLPRKRRNRDHGLTEASRWTDRAWQGRRR